MKLGLSLPMFTADVGRPLTAAARAAAAGYDGVFAPDHLFPPGAPGRPALEPFAVLAAVAALHPDLHVGTLVTRASLRPAGLLAKQAAALDQMSGGRAILGLGAGDSVSKPEHEAFGIPFASTADRVAILEETAGALRALFGGEPMARRGACSRDRRAAAPARRPELWVGGRSARGDRGGGPVRRRLERLGDGRRCFRGGRRRAPPARRRPPGRSHLGRDRPRRNRRGRPGTPPRGTPGQRACPWTCGRETPRPSVPSPIVCEEAGCSWVVVLPVGGEDRHRRRGRRRSAR